MLTYQYDPAKAKQLLDEAGFRAPGAIEKSAATSRR